MWSSEPQKGLAVCRAKIVSSLLHYVKTLSIGPAKDPKLCLVSHKYICILPVYIECKQGGKMTHSVKKFYCVHHIFFMIKRKFNSLTLSLWEIFFPVDLNRLE